MSAKNGDRSRHHRLRKQKERRRVILRALRVNLATPVAVIPAATAAEALGAVDQAVAAT
jgi:hypothetical protein